MKYPLLLAFISLMIPLSAQAGGSAGGWGYAGGSTGGMGVVADNKEMALSYVGEFDRLSVLKASRKAFSAIETAQDPNVTLMLQNRIVTGRILEPEFAGAVSIKTDEGANLIIIDETALGEDAATKSAGN